MRERHQGMFEGTAFGTFQTFIQDNGLDILTYTPKEGEFILNFQKHIIAYYEEVKNVYEGKNVFFITHARVLFQLYMHLYNKTNTYENYLSEHANISCFTITKNNVETYLNSREHLV